MKDFLIVIHGHNKVDHTEEETQNRVRLYNEWADELGEKHVAGQRLHKTGRYLKSRDEIFSDGPFLESKELLVGFAWIKAESFEDALKVTKQCPLIESHELELREIYT